MEREQAEDDEAQDEVFDLIPMDTFNVHDGHVTFPIDEAAWSGSPPSPVIIRSPNKRHKYGRRQRSPSSRSPSLHSYRSGREHLCSSASINQGFQDFQRQESSLLTRFDGDNILLFNTPKNRSTSTRKKLLGVWCSAFTSRLCYCTRSMCSCDCSCTDERGVHCMQKLKQRVMKQLLIVQGILCVVSAILSGMVFLPLGNITADFEGECLLFSNVYLTWISKNESVKLDLSRSTFGSENQCNYTTFINVVVFIASLFFLWFFIHSRDVRGGPEQSDVKLHLPVLLTYFILMVCVIVSSYKITMGFNRWCNNMVLNNPVPHKRLWLKCADFEQLSWVDPYRRSTFYTYTVIAEISSWMLALTLFLQCCITSVRLYRNFKASYEVLEITHVKLEESSMSSETSLSRRLSEDFPLSLDIPTVPVQTYKVEYKDRKILAQVVFHKDNTASFAKAGPGGTIVLDAGKLKNHAKRKMSRARSRKKVDLQCNFKAGKQRKRRNWTGSLEFDPTSLGSDSPIKSAWPFHNYEWHGFDNDTENRKQLFTSHSFEWPYDEEEDEEEMDEEDTDQQGSESEMVQDIDKQGSDTVFNNKKKKRRARDKFKWPSCGDIPSDSNKHLTTHSFEWHGFENDFLTQKHMGSRVWHDVSGEFGSKICKNRLSRSLEWHRSESGASASFQTLSKPQDLNWHTFNDGGKEKFEWPDNSDDAKEEGESLIANNSIEDPWAPEGSINPWPSQSNGDLWAVEGVEDDPWGFGMDPWVTESSEWLEAVQEYNDHKHSPITNSSLSEQTDHNGTDAGHSPLRAKLSVITECGGEEGSPEDQTISADCAIDSTTNVKR